MKALIIYYSRTGHCRKVAEALAGNLAADVEEIVDTKNRSGALASLAAGKDAAIKRLTDIKPTEKDPAPYDLVVIGTPVWAFTMAPAVRTWLTRNASKLPRMAFFCTMGGSGDERTFDAMAEVAGKHPAATLAVLDKELKSGAYADRVVEFAANLRALTGPPNA